MTLYYITISVIRTPHLVIWSLNYKMLALIICTYKNSLKLIVGNLMFLCWLFGRFIQPCHHSVMLMWGQMPVLRSFVHQLYWISNRLYFMINMKCNVRNFKIWLSIEEKSEILDELNNQSSLATMEWLKSTIKKTRLYILAQHHIVHIFETTLK